MIGVSGCFGGAKVDYPIDDVDEAAAAVEEIVETTDPVPTEQQPGPAPDLALAQLVGQYARRVRLLTWAVVAIAIMIVLKEV